MAIAAIAPILWGSTYFVTRNFLPLDAPLWGSVYRALPAGLVLLLIVRKLPQGAWWWRSVVLGVLNVGGFFVLIYIAGTRLPSSLAATLMSASAAAMMFFGWAILRQRPRLIAVAGAFTGIIGVAIMMGVSRESVDPIGVTASLGAMLSSALGFTLTAKWGSAQSPVALASWQLTAGGLMLVPVALMLEGAPIVPTGSALIGFAYISLIATALAYAAWFAGLKHLTPGLLGVIGLLNPVTGVVLGVVVAHEAFGLWQAVGIGIVLLGIVLGTVPGNAQRKEHDVVKRAARTN